MVGEIQHNAMSLRLSSPGALLRDIENHQETLVHMVRHWGIPVALALLAWRKFGMNRQVKINKYGV